MFVMRDNNRNSGRRDSGRGRDFGRGRDSDRPRFDRSNDRQLHKVTCDGCKEECEVPFKPTQGKPVLCRDCFRK